MRILAIFLIALVCFPLAAKTDQKRLDAIESNLYADLELSLSTIQSESKDKSNDEKTLLELLALEAEVQLSLGRVKKSSEIANRLITEASKRQLNNLYAKGLQRQASVLLYQGELNDALTKYEKASAIFIENKDNRMNAYALMGVGNVYGQLGELEKALDAYLRSLKIMQSITNDYSLDGLYNNIGSVYYWMGRFHQAIDFYQKSVEQAQRLGNSKQLALQYANIGEAYVALNDNDKALENFRQAQNFISANTPPYYIISINLPLGRFELKQGNSKQAEIHFDKVIALAKESDTEDWLAEAYLGKAELLADRDIDGAITMAKEGLTLSQKINKTVFIGQSYWLLSQLSARASRYKQAFDYGQLYSQNRENALEANRQAEVAKVAGLLELEQKNHEILLLKKDQVIEKAKVADSEFRRNILFGSILSLLLVLVAFYRFNQHRLQAKKEKQIADELRVLDKLKDEFLANTSHELRTPLSAIVGLSEIILDQGVKNYDEAQLTELISLMKNSGDNLIGTVQDILDFSAIQQGTTKVNIQSVDLSEIVGRIVKEKSSANRNPSLSIVNLLEHTDISVKGDPRLLYRLLLNLVDNAIKFTPEGEVSISANQENGCMKVSVKDSGIGFSKQDQALIFERFRQIDGSSSRGFGGTGLGLAIVKELTELMNGRITVSSKEGKGSCFELWLPLWNENH